MSSTVTKRDAAKKLLLSIRSWIQRADESVGLAEVRAASERLEKAYDAFIKHHKAIMAVTGAAEAEFQKIEYASGLDIYVEANAAFEALLDHMGASRSAKTSPTSGGSGAGSGAVNKSGSGDISLGRSDAGSGAGSGTCCSDVSIASSAAVNEADGGAVATIDSSALGQHRSVSDDQSTAHLLGPSQPSQPNQNEIVARKVGVAIRRLCTWTRQATLEEVSLSLALAQDTTLNNYWSTYTGAMFSDWNAEIGEDYQAIENMYLRSKENLTNIIHAHKQRAAMPIAANLVAPASAGVKSEPHLPRIQIPTFSGTFQDWSSFYDLFTSMVDSSPNLSGVQKMHYLRTSVKGEAENLIRTYKCTEANYTAAWNALKERYNNRRLIINAHLEQFLSIPIATTESASIMRDQLDTFAEAVRAMTALELPAAQQWDLFLVHYLQSKLDPSTKRAWEMSLTSDELPTFVQLRNFIERRCRAIEGDHFSASKSIRIPPRFTTGGDVRNVAPTSAAKQPTTTHKARAFITTTNHNPSCVLCKKVDHVIGSCPDFIRLYPGERYRKACELKICFNCLRTDHVTTACSSGSCRKCGRRHHSLLHYNEQKPAATTTQASFMSFNFTDNVLLATAMAMVECRNGAHHLARVLLDNGSQMSFITERFVQLSGLSRTKAAIPVSGLSMVNAGQTRGLVEFFITSTHGATVKHHVKALVLSRITNAMPNASIDTSLVPFLTTIPQLADPSFGTPGENDILLGSNMLGHMMLDGRQHAENDRALFACNTTLGWVIAGPIPGAQSCSLRTLVSLPAQIELDQILQRFWELEALGTIDTRTPEEQACENHFKNTHRRTDDGRFVVELPFRVGVPPLGDSKSAAAKSLQHLERRFGKDEELRRQYTQFVNEYIQLGHMSLVNHSCDEQCSFYLPHHPVFKASSTTTKIRVVFDASRKTSSGISLNDAIMVGPKLQDDLVNILLRFRSHAVAFCGDLVKMYRQIRTTPASSEYQRILWRSSPEDEISTYRLDTVTYGTASASYLSTKALQQLAADESHRYPLASAVAMTDFYVDDLMTGCDNIDGALVLQKQLIALMEAGGFTLSKWASNINELLEGVPENQREINCPLQIHTDASIKTLGLSWNPSADCFQYRVSMPKIERTLTKRTILSEIASLFDPLGLLSPLIISAKIFMQTLWAEGVGWDEPLLPRLADRWHAYRDDLPSIHAINIPRWLGYHGTSTHQLHGFCDASEAAYAAVVYLRSTNDAGKCIVRIITARTKVAPVKKISVPRLELCGAVLLAKLLAHVKAALKQPSLVCQAWCDSTVTVAWIRKPSHNWQTFVANRVSIIQELIPSENWSHIPGAENPADAASRGLTASTLVTAELWWQGPAWLTRTSDHWPRSREEFITHIDEKQSVTVLHAAAEPLAVLLRFSSYTRLQRITALLRRFIFNCQSPKKSRRTGIITMGELTESTHHWALLTQALEFTAEIAACKADKALLSKSALATLNPFLDDIGLLRVGGRIGNAHIAYNARHPVILPKRSHLAYLVVAYEHQRNLHSGPQLTIAAIRQNYWIISVRSVVKQFIHRCPVCVRHRHTPAKQRMAALPERRIVPTRAFLTTGVDYAGPITIKLQPGRGTKTSKAYIALFVCFSTKALHLELVSSLTTEAFLAAFRRFVARRGRCANLHSDCGTNFVGACKELRALQTAVHQQFLDTTIADTLASDGTQWHFNPPGAPSFGGIWEAGVKSVKHHLRRVLGTSLLTFEELYTTLTQIEAILNSRPIAPMSDDANDPQALTPGHFLIGEPMNTVPDPCVADHAPLHRRWRNLQAITQHFWQRWQREYITTLQQRFKWTKSSDNIEIGTLALIMDETLPPARWSLGRVVELHPGTDGLVRVVTLKYKSGFVKRPIIKLCIFPKINTNTYN